LNAHDGEKVARDSGGRNARGFPVPGDGGEAAIEFSKTGERVRLVAKVFEVGIGGGDARALRVLLPETNYLIGIFVWKWTEENAVNDGEDGGGGADTEGEGENSDGGEGGILAEKARGETGVPKKSFEERKPTNFAMELEGLLRAAELDERLAVRFGWGHSGANILLGGESDVRHDFGLQIVIQLIALEESRETTEKA
jgi:hypothetical protein